MRPAQRRCDGALRPGRIIKPIIAGISVGLQDAGKAGEVPPGMLLPAVARGVIERSRRRGAAERAIVADIEPAPAKAGVQMCPVTVLPLARIGTVVSSPERTCVDAPVYARRIFKELIDTVWC